MSLGLVPVVGGALLLITYGLSQSEPAVVSAVNAAATGSPVSGQDVSAGDLWFGIAAVAAGAVLRRRARRHRGGRRVPLDAARYQAARPVLCARSAMTR